MIKRVSAPCAGHLAGSTPCTLKHATVHHHSCKVNPRQLLLPVAPKRLQIVTHVQAPNGAAAAPARAQFPLSLPPLDGAYEAACAFQPYANWIIPGHVLLGRYPYVEPSQCPSRDQGELQVEAIVAAGVTTFVSLQAELPPQAELPIGGKDGFLPYRATATLIAAALSEHPAMEEIGGLRTPDLDKFLPPRRKKAAAPPRRRIELEFVHCPLVDLSIPQDKQLAALLADMSARLQGGQRLYVHCWGGRGRAGTVGAALLASLYGVGADEALERVQRAFDTRGDEGRRSPETEEQHAYVRRFIATALGSA